VWSVSSALGPIGYVISGAALSLGAVFARKLLRDEGTRQRSYRQGQAKTAVAKFLDEVGFEMNKDTRDGLRRTQRRLRDDFQARAMMMQTSSNAALGAVQRAVGLDPQSLAHRESDLADEQRQLTELRRTLATVAGRPRAA
jgi:hypothetical protein